MGHDIHFVRWHTPSPQPSAPEDAKVYKLKAKNNVGQDPNQNDENNFAHSNVADKDSSSPMPLNTSVPTISESTTSVSPNQTNENNVVPPKKSEPTTSLLPTKDTNDPPPPQSDDGSQRLDEKSPEKEVPGPDTKCSKKSLSKSQPAQTVSDTNDGSSQNSFQNSSPETKLPRNRIHEYVPYRP